MIRWLSVCVGVVAVLAMTRWHEPPPAPAAPLAPHVEAAASASPAQEEEPPRHGRWDAPDYESAPTVRGYERRDRLYADGVRLAAELGFRTEHVGQRLRLTYGKRVVMLTRGTTTRDGWVPSPEGVMLPLRAALAPLGFTLRPGCVPASSRPDAGPYDAVEVVVGGHVRLRVALAGEFQLRSVSRSAGLGDVTLVLRGLRYRSEIEVVEDDSHSIPWLLDGDRVLAPPHGVDLGCLGYGDDGRPEILLRDVTGDGRAEILAIGDAYRSCYNAIVLAVEQTGLRPLLGGVGGLDIDNRLGGPLLAHLRPGRPVVWHRYGGSRYPPCTASDTTFEWNGTVFAEQSCRAVFVPDDDAKSRLGSPDTEFVDLVLERQYAEP